MKKELFDFIIKMTLLVGIIAITLIGLLLKLDTAEVAAGDGVLGMALMGLITKPVIK